MAWTRNWQSQRRASNEAEAHPAISAAAGPFKTSWVLATFVLIAVIAGGLLYWKSRDQSSGSEIVASSRQAAGPPSQQSAGSPTRQPVGFGAITISNLKTRTVEAYDQSSIAQGTFSPGYAGTISPTTPTLQVPAGTYKLKFDNHLVSLPNLTRTAEVYDQDSIAQGTFSPGYAGTISPPATTLQVPAGTYKL